ncbi:MAG: alpha/beta fold hydrolase [Candidatus Limnocylindria bacterium]
MLAISPSGVQGRSRLAPRLRGGPGGWLGPGGRVRLSPQPRDARSRTGVVARNIQQPQLLRRLATPYLAVVGSDEVRPSWPVEQVAALVPRGEVVLIEGAGHCPWWTHPTELRQAAMRLG